MLDGLQEIADLTEDQGNYSLEWNPHRSSYEDVAGYLDSIQIGPDDFQSNGEFSRAIQEQTIVTIQWYKNSPVGFVFYAAPDLQSLFRWQPWKDGE